MSSLLNKLTGKHTSTDTTHQSTTSGVLNAPSTLEPNLHATSGTTHTTTNTTTGSGISSPYNVQGHTTDAMNTGTTGSTTTRHDDAMTRSEEQLKVGKETVPIGQVTLNKYVTTEHAQTSVPVKKEAVVVEREPIDSTNMNKALSGPDIKENSYSVPLFEERVEAIKETVPIERIRLRKVEEHQSEKVEADIRKEHIDLIDNTAGKGVILEPSSKNSTNTLNRGTNQQGSTITGR